MLFGGLEFIVGGYVLHRVHKNKNEKKKLEEEAQRRRNKTFPGAGPTNRPQHHPHRQQQQQQQQQQKYASYAPQPQHHSPPQRQYQPRPQPPQTFAQNRPYPPQLQPQPIPQYLQQIQPLNRSDSFTTLSNMPVANGARYNPPPPPQRQPSNLLAIPRRPVLNAVYNNAGFSVSTPSFGPSAMTRYTRAPSPAVGTHTVDDNWETYAPHSPHVHFAVSGPQPGEEGEADPPPPYRP